MYIYLLRRPAQVSLHALLAKSLNKKHLSIHDTLHFPISRFLLSIIIFTGNNENGYLSTTPEGRIHSKAKHPHQHTTLKR